MPGTGRKTIRGKERGFPALAGTRTFGELCNASYSCWRRMNYKEQRMFGHNQQPSKVECSVSRSAEVGDRSKGSFLGYTILVVLINKISFLAFFRLVKLINNHHSSPKLVNIRCWLICKKIPLVIYKSRAKQKSI